MSGQTPGIWFIGAGKSGAPLSVDGVGFKAYNLWRMDRIGMPVPPAFVFDTGVCREYFRAARQAPPDIRNLLATRIRELERLCALGFGNARRPLLVSVRSGAAVSMPGMMETVLDVGLCDASVAGMLRVTGNPRLVWDSYCRLVRSFAEVVHQVPGNAFDDALTAQLQSAHCTTSDRLDFQGLRELTRAYLDVFENAVGQPFPQDPLDQLVAAVTAVWESWAADKAVRYRRLHGIDDDLGTAVVVQQMVFGNAGGTSGSGVAFTRNPATGARGLYLEFAFNAQGEDVVAGRRDVEDAAALPERLPDVHAAVVAVAKKLEAEFRDVQEFEFTIQDARLFILQTRDGKRTPWAALHVAVDMVEEGLIDEATALARLSDIDLASLQRRRIIPGAGGRVLGRAISASSGVAVGEIALDASRAEAIAQSNRAAILVRVNTSTEDIGGIAAAQGLLTATGGRTSHAAVVARQMDKVCLVGCHDLTIDLTRRGCTLGTEWMPEGSVISLDGEGGAVIAGAVEVTQERPTRALARVDGWRNSAAAM